jgi:molybdenum cofactor cytidylyltransferase
MGAMRFPGFVPLVLCAGASSRMGQPKELLQFHGVTCLELVLDACARGGCDTPILVTRGDREAAIRDFVDRHALSVRVVVNLSPELGQTSSLRVGVAALPAGTRAFLVFPVDHPLVRAEDVSRLCEAFTSAPPPSSPSLSPSLVVAPSFAQRRGHPVVVDATLAPAVLALGPDQPARAILSDPAHTRFVTFDDDRVLEDMDTPEAYARCLARYRARTHPR